MENCRLCRKANLDFPESVFSSRGDQQIADIIMKICPIVGIIVGDGLPSKICDDCLEVVISADELQRISVESDMFYRSQFRHVNVVEVDGKPEKFQVKEEVLSDVPLEDLGADNCGFSGSESKVFELQQTRTQTTFNPRPVSGQSASYINTFYRCNFCGIKLKPRLNAIRHMLRKHDPLLKPFGCKFCTQRFYDESMKDSHEYEKHGNEAPTILFCDICGASGSSRKGMDQHKVDDHKHPKQQKRSYEGNGSDDSITAKRKVVRSRDKRFNPRPLAGCESLPYEEIWFSCNFCSKKLKQRKIMLRHMRGKHDPEKLPAGCRFCVERFKSVEILSEHERMFHENDKHSTIFCDICGASGSSLAGMENHRTDDHKVAANLTITSPPGSDDVEKLLTKRGDYKFHPRPLLGFQNLKYDDVRYSCNFCDKIFKPRKSMLRHMKMKHDPEVSPFGCDHCVERFISFEGLSKHKAEHKGKEVARILFCDLCGVSGDRRDGMESHMTDDHLNFNDGEKAKKTNFHVQAGSEASFKCDVCSKIFGCKSLLRSHVQSLHEQLYRVLSKSEVEQNLKCCACSASFGGESEFLEHLHTHRENFKSVKCSHRTVAANTFELFLKHSKYQMKPKTHECLKCHKRFPYDVNFLSHLNSHKRRQNHQLNCEKCGKKFRNRRALETHDKVKHHQQTLFICPICAKSMSSEYILDNHIRFVHNAEQEKKHECKVCSMKFTHSSKLVRHEATHSTERPHVCEQCGAGFKHKEGLTIHIKRHNGTLVKRFECNQCNNKFTTQHRLAQHALTHSGAKPNECSYCDRAYASKGDLVKHLQKVHVGSAVYKCTKCSEGFPRIVELREHLLVHYEDH